MTAGHQARRGQAHHSLLADDDAVDVLFDAPQQLSGATRRELGFPVQPTTLRTSLVAVLS